MIIFAHGNGFVGEVYAPFMAALQTGSAEPIRYVSSFGQPAKYAPTTSLLPLVQQLLDLAQSSSKPLTGIGHSMGAVVLLLAHYLHKGLFDRLVLMDPPLFIGQRAWLVWVAQQLGIASSIVPIARKTQRRRDAFSSQTEAEAYWKNKSFFAHFHPEAFAQYVRHGLTQTPNGNYTLTIPKALERRFFALPPPVLPIGRMPHILRLRPLEIESYLLYSAQYPLLRRTDIRYIARKLTDTTFIPMVGGHMFPLESPVVVGQFVRKLLKETSLH